MQPYSSHGDETQGKRRQRCPVSLTPFQDWLSLYVDSERRVGSMLIIHTQQMNERPSVSHSHSDLILGTQIGTQGVHEGNRMERGNSRTSWGLWPKRETRPLWPSQGLWKAGSGAQPPLRTAGAFTLEKLPPQLYLQGLLYPSSHGNSRYSPISALPTFFSICRKRHRTRNSARKKVPKLSSHCNVIKPLGGFYPPAQSCLKEPAAIKEMFNSLHIPKQEPRAMCGSCVLKFSWWDFPVGSKVKIPHSQCSRHRCDPW